MKKTWIVMLMAALLAALVAPAAWAQTTSIKGSVKDPDGKPIPGAVLEFQNMDNGRRMTLKTDNSGNYFSIGVPPGKYKITLMSAPGLPQPYVAATGFPITLAAETNVFDLDMSKERTRAEKTMSPEEKAKLEAAQKENVKIKGLNEKLAMAQQQQQAGDLPGAIATLNQATQMDATKDVLWAKLADMERLSAQKATDKDSRTKLYSDAVEHYKRAAALKPNGAYYNNMGDALARSGNTQGAIEAYTQAAQVDPAGAAGYYFNMGAVLTNTGKVDEAIAAFDKAIATDPARADAYYWKGVNMIGKAKLGEGGKMVAPDGTADAFNKYLELAPDGQFAQPAKDMLASIGAKVETSYGKGKASTKKK